MSWSNQVAISNSKIVKSSGVWFILVPVMAKLIEPTGGKVHFNFGNNSYLIELSLPFQWQLFFFASLCFLIANIIYQVRCYKILKKYNSFTEFSNDGNTRRQIHQHLKYVVFDKAKKEVSSKFKISATAFLSTYTNSGKLDSFIESLDNIANVKGSDNDAFYFVQTVADQSRPNSLKASWFFYGVGFFFILMIFISNICYVTETVDWTLFS